MGFLRVVVECLLALAEQTRGWTTVEGVTVHEVLVHVVSVLSDSHVSYQVLVVWNR